jgi:amino acid transporter
VHAEVKSPGVRAAAAERDEGLVRAIGTSALTAAILNIIIGAGVFVLPAAVARESGLAAPIAVLVCAIGIGFVALSFAAAGSRVSTSGGPYGYVDAAFGPFTGFIAGWLLWLGNVFASAAIAAGLAGILVALGGAAPPAWLRSVVIVVTFAILASVHLRGVHDSAQIVTALTVAKLIPLLVFLALGVFLVDPANLTMTDPISVQQVGRGVALLVFSFAGMEAALAPSGEVRDPARTVPRAVIIALLVTTALYLAVQLVSQGVLGPGLRDSPAPLADALLRALPAGAAVVLIGSIISMTGSIAGIILGASRVLFAFARDGILPSGLATLHPTTRVPHVAVIAHAVIACLFALTGTFSSLAFFAGLAIASLYVLGCAAALMLQRRDVATAGTPFRLPGGPLIPILGIAMMAWVISQATLSEGAALLGAIGVGALLYVVSRLLRGRQRETGPAGL